MAEKGKPLDTSIVSCGGRSVQAGTGMEIKAITCMYIHHYQKSPTLYTHISIIPHVEL